jgi:hypothetical protein
MPLLDHFRPPLSQRRQFQSVHSAWINAMVVHLNEEVLPARFVALPNVQIAQGFEIDVATLDVEIPSAAVAAGGAAVWAPARPTISTTVDFTDVDVFEVRVMNEEEGNLVAAVELVSPANKDRPEQREAFAIKCASYLQQDISLVIVDVVTTRATNMHRQLLALLHQDGLHGTEFDLYAVAYRMVPANGKQRLEAWPMRLTLGEPMPTVPLWLDVGLSAPLDLEKSYLAMCRALRVKQ